jgi:hypothetical protein
MTWKDQINKVLRDYQQGHLCADCIAAMLPHRTALEVQMTLREMISAAPYYVSRSEGKCSRCGNAGEVFACD